MKSRSLTLFLAGIATFFLVNNCVLEQADIPKQRELVIVSDQFTEKDSSIILQYAKLTNSRITMKIKSPQDYLLWIQNHPYQPEADVIWFQNDSIYTVLIQEGKLSMIRKDHLFAKLDRQFNVQDRFYLPITHNPLVVSIPKDSGGICRELNFTNWHLKDSLRPAFYSNTTLRTYYTQLNKAPFIHLWSKNRSYSNEQIYSLSDLSEQYLAADSMYRKLSFRCNYYLLNRGKYITVKSALAIPKYARNKAGANALIAFLAQQHEYLAFGRNEHSCFKNASGYKNVKSLEIKK